MSSVQQHDDFQRPKRTRSGVGRLVDASRASFDGLAAALRHEEAFRIELACALLFAPLGLWLGANGVERALLAGSVLGVLIVELLNSGIEAAVDRISLENHPLSKRAKDFGSAAVMLSILLAGAVWLLVLAG
jgi:diacylglycerol kinase (ATP)